MLETKSFCHTFKTISSKLRTREIHLQGCTLHGTINLEHIGDKMVQEWFRPAQAFLHQFKFSKRKFGLNMGGPDKGRLVECVGVG